MSHKKSPADFHFGNRIGEGSYSSVYKALDASTRKVYAIKVLSKKHIVKENKIKYVNIEKITLNRLGRHPGIVTLHYTFQDEASLYFVIDFAEYGELLTMIRKLGSLSENCAKYYMYQLIDAVEFMHSRGVIHRDLKPENILVNSERKIMITDFGAAKVLNLDENEDVIQDDKSFQKGSFVGTAEYVSPELLKYNKCGFESDIWAIGCILYQFIVGVPPFKGKTEYLTFEKIVNLEYSWPSYFIPELIKDLVLNLLKSNPEERLTISQIQKHGWFSRFNWNDKSKIWLMSPPTLEPYRPLIEQQLNSNVSNFQKIYIQKTPVKKNNKKELLNQIRNDSSFIIPSKTQRNQPVYKPVVNSPGFSSSPQQQQIRPRVASTQKVAPQTSISNNSNTNVKLQLAAKSISSQQQLSKLEPPKIQTKSPFAASTSNGNSPAQEKAPKLPLPSQSPIFSQESVSKLQPPPVITTQSKSTSPTPSPITKSQASPSPSTTASLPSQKQTSSARPPQIPVPVKPAELPASISSKLSNKEKIIKLDEIYLTELLHEEQNIGLTDVSINKIILKNGPQLNSLKKIVLLMITDLGNLYIFRIDEAVSNDDYENKFKFYLKINLTSKFFAMYDYEFNENETNVSKKDELASGFLILEVLKFKKLIFLSLLDKSKSLIDHDPSIIINHNAEWIGSLMKVKELLKNTKTSPPKSEQNGTKLTTEKSNGSKTNGTSSNTTSLSSTSKQTKTNGTIPTTSNKTKLSATSSSPSSSATAATQKPQQTRVNTSMAQALRPQKSSSPKISASLATPSPKTSTLPSPKVSSSSPKLRSSSPRQTLAPPPVSSFSSNGSHTTTTTTVTMKRIPVVVSNGAKPRTVQEKKQQDKKFAGSGAAAAFIKASK